MNEIIPSKEENSGIDPQIIPKLVTYEDYLLYYIQLSQTHDSVSWVKADLLVQMQRKLGKNSIVLLSKELKQPASTTSAYVRVAKAFPIERRDFMMSFTIHLKASYADDYDDTKGVFWGEERFYWLKKAADNNWKSRRLEAEILDNKVKKRTKSTYPCVKCGTKEKLVRQYTMYPLGVTSKANKFYMDEDCFFQLLNYIYGNQET
ncbi:MAG: hypothetical protein AAB441_02960 [Patescibacteria group bacterium]